MNCKDNTRTTAEAWYRRHAALNDTSPELERHHPLWINELCQPCCITAERTEYVEKSLGIWLAHAASPPPLPSLDLHSWHKLLLQCNLSSSTEFDKNSWVFCIFMCLVKCRLLERNPLGGKRGPGGSAAKNLKGLWGLLLLCPGWLFAAWSRSE